MSKNKGTLTWKNKVSWGCDGTRFLKQVGYEWGEAPLKKKKKKKLEEEEDRDKVST